MKTNSLTKNVVSLILLTLILKGFGFVNRILIAFYFGTSEFTDIFYNASGFVDSVVATITASLSVAITNIYLENKNRKNNDCFVSSLVIVLSAIMQLLTILVFIFSFYISSFLAPGYTIESKKVLANTLWLLSLTFPFHGVIAVYSSVLQAEKNFIPVKLTGTISSILTIISMVLLAGQYGINALIISYILGSVLNAFFLIFSARKDVSFRFKLDLDAIQWKRIFKMMIPLLIATAAHELNLTIDRSIASGIATGAVSALSYSCVLYLFIENVIINSLVMALFPELKEKAIRNSQERIAMDINNVIFFGETLLIPVSIWIALNTTEITKLIYMRGSFDMDSLSLTSAALVGYIVGLPFLFVRNICMQFFYANENTKTPVRYNLIAIGINIVLDYIMANLFGIIGITLATSIASIISATFMLSRCSRENDLILSKRVKKELLLLFISNFMTGLLFYCGKKLSENLFFQLPLFVVGVLFELMFLVLLRSEIIKNALGIIKEKIIGEK